MKKGFKILGVLAIVLLVFYMLIPLQMGEGSERYAQKWETRLQGFDHPESALSRFEEVDDLIFPDGTWIFWVSSNSHGNPWGGTVVTKDNYGSTRVFFGHVCGSARIQGESLDSVYKALNDQFTMVRELEQSAGENASRPTP
jgi:hypothetical protein